MRFNKRSSSQLKEVERGIAGGDERGALPSSPLNTTEKVATAGSSDVNSAAPANATQATMASKPDTAEHAPLGAEEKVQ